jgi:hypothetical protein
VLLHELLTKSRWASVLPGVPTSKQLRFPFDLNEQNSIGTPLTVISQNPDPYEVAMLFEEFSERTSEEVA